MSGKLLLLPNLLDETQPHELYLPAGVGAAVKTLNGLVAESEKSARRYLRRFLSHDEMARMPLKTLNEHTQEKELDGFLEPLLNGETWGVISDAGLPCIADPGAGGRPRVRACRARRPARARSPGRGSRRRACRRCG